MHLTAQKVFAREIWFTFKILI